jgi:hypothetical protein
MHYEVEVNLARPGAPQVWRPVVEADGAVSRWAAPDTAMVEMTEEGRVDFRVVRVDDDGTRSALRMTIFGLAPKLPYDTQRA